MDIIQNLIVEKINSKLFGKMAEENQKKIKEEMTEIEPAKKFGFSEETEEKPAFFFKGSLK